MDCCTRFCKVLRGLIDNFLGYVYLKQQGKLSLLGSVLIHSGTSDSYSDCPNPIIRTRIPNPNPNPKAKPIAPIPIITNPSIVFHHILLPTRVPQCSAIRLTESDPSPILILLSDLIRTSYSLRLLINPNQIRLFLCYSFGLMSHGLLV